VVNNSSEFPELRNTLTQAEAFERLCPLRGLSCEGSGCMGWVWDPVGQRDARSARGRCGMVAS
jgi:hypothetical protein